jgi:hypothetical protein
MRAPAPGEGAVALAGGDEVCLTVQILAAGLKFPVLRLVREVLDHLNLGSGAVATKWVADDHRQCDNVVGVF